MSLPEAPGLTLTVNTCGSPALHNHMCDFAIELTSFYILLIGEVPGAAIHGDPPFNGVLSRGSSSQSGLGRSGPPLARDRRCLGSPGQCRSFGPPTRVFQICYLNDGDHTVRGLAAEMSVSKPAITRALDRLGEFDLARRKTDPQDRRSVLVQRTAKGAAFLREIRGFMTEASGEGRESHEASYGLIHVRAAEKPKCRPLRAANPGQGSGDLPAASAASDPTRASDGRLSFSAEAVPRPFVPTRWPWQRPISPLHTRRRPSGRTPATPISSGSSSGVDQLIGREMPLQRFVELLGPAHRPAPIRGGCTTG